MKKETRKPNQMGKPGCSYGIEKMAKILGLSQDMYNSEENTADMAANASGSFITIIMQGNTQSASDCRTFQTGLSNSGNGYYAFVRYGWNLNSDIPETTRVTASEVASMKNYDVAYYSGHGGTRDSTGSRFPIINYIPSNPSANYGISSPINVAQLFNLDVVNWQSSTTLSSSNSLRVLVLAACSQLDSSIVKYYARMMKASGIRAIAGYHDTAPSLGDDIIATNFINYASQGNSVWYSWQHANSGYNWAVLVYKENANQFYRLPGFPGNQYVAPSSSASVYRYANFLSDSQQVTLAIHDDWDERIETLPLSLTTACAENKIFSSGREVWDTEASVDDNVSIVEEYFAKIKEKDILSDKICVQHYIERTQVDEDTGILENTRTVVERTYDFFDTYAGVKIVDSYVSASIDAKGINNIVDNRKMIVSNGASAKELLASKQTINFVSTAEAISAIQQEIDCDVRSVSLAYVPTDNGIHKLCYEMRTDHGFYYFELETGAAVNTN